MSSVLRVAWYRFRVTLGRRWGSYLSVVVLIGLVGGLAMGAVAAARRTQSSFPAFRASTNPSDMSVFTGPVPVNVLARLTLVASVRRRRHDLALLKTLGFTRRQLAVVVAWQSSIAVLIGTVVGITIGIVLGRFLWNTFAREINAVPAPAVPALAIVLIALGALVLANVVAAIPGRIAARTSTALLLRAERRIVPSHRRLRLIAVSLGQPPPCLPHRNPDVHGRRRARKRAGGVPVPCPTRE